MLQFCRTRRAYDLIPEKELSNEQERAWISMVYTYNRLTDRINQVFKNFQITNQQFNVLRILRGRQGQVACCSDVKEVMLDKNPDLTRLCDRLVTKGLIKREFNQFRSEEHTSELQSLMRIS